MLENLQACFTFFAPEDKAKIPHAKVKYFSKIANKNSNRKRFIRVFIVLGINNFDNNQRYYTRRGAPNGIG